LTDGEAKELSKHIARLKRNAQRRSRYAEKKALFSKKTTPTVLAA
jgi:hypothetical protein